MVQGYRDIGYMNMGIQRYRMLYKEYRGTFMDTRYTDT